MGVAILGMLEEKASTKTQLKKPHAIKNELKRDKRCLKVEKASRSGRAGG